MTALKGKYGKSVKLDLSSYLENTGTHHKGEAMKDEDDPVLYTKSTYYSPKES